MEELDWAGLECMHGVVWRYGSQGCDLQRRWLLLHDESSFGAVPVLLVDTTGVFVFAARMLSTAVSHCNAGARL